jgi:hypothetical protein
MYVYLMLVLANELLCDEGSFQFSFSLWYQIGILTKLNYILLFNSKDRQNWGSLMSNVGNDSAYI